jgi:hypothetical protein
MVLIDADEPSCASNVCQGVAMKKSGRWNLSSLRSLGLRRSARTHESRGNVAGRLLRKAGLATDSVAAGRSNASLEELEARRLMFSITISEADIDPETGIGARNEYFGYVVPMLGTQQDVQDTDNREVTENFNDEPGNVDAQNIFSGQIFNNSNILTRHNISPASAYQIRRASATDQDKFLRLSLQDGQFAEYSVVDQAGFPLAARSLQFTVRNDRGNPFGLDADNIAVQLFYRGEVVRTYTGASLLAAKVGGGTSPGTGDFLFVAPDDPAAFDNIRIIANAGPNTPFDIDDFAFSLPAGRFAGITNSRIFGAQITLSGPVGATVQVLDMYGRDMVRTIALGQPQGSQVTLVDPGDNGIPDFNEGIGRIVVSGSDSRTNVSVWGGTVRASQNVDPDDDFVEDGFVYRNIEQLNGQFNTFEQSGFGYHIDLRPPQLPPPDGLPNSGGSVIIGSPLVRNLNNYNPTGLPPVEDNALASVFGPGILRITPGHLDVVGGFNRADQGIFVNGPIGVVQIHGVVHGSSRFEGSVGTLALGKVLGSVTVAGDIGSFYVASDAGRWTRDDGSETVVSNNQFTFGRTVGDINIAGRSPTPITVVGDDGDPTIRPPKDVFVYKEREFVLSVAEEFEPEFVLQTNMSFYDRLEDRDIINTIDRNFLQAGSVFGNTLYRNDSIMAAEYVGTASGGVRIQGSYSGRETSVNTGDDDADVYAFAADGVEPVTLQFVTQGNMYLRVMDQDGRVISSIQRPRGVNDLFSEEQSITFVPPTPGVYYAVVTDATEFDGQDGAVTRFYYSLVITGMAATSLGSYRTGAGSGGSVNVLNGSAGQIRIGTGYVTGAGALASLGSQLNGDSDLDWAGGTITVPGNLYSVVAGANVDNGVSVLVGGQFGTFRTGASPIGGVVGGTDNVTGLFTLQTGGDIAMVDIRGTINSLPGAVRIISGRDSKLTGNIGMIRVGGNIVSDSLQVITPDLSTVGALFVSQDIAPTGDTRYGMWGGSVGSILQLGSGSDLRFFDVPEIDLKSNANASVFLFENTPVRFTDDGGSEVQIRIVGPVTGRFGGLVRILPIDGSEGVAVGRIEVDLSPGTSLEIQGTGAANSTDVISIGRIIVSGAAAGVSGVSIIGNVEVDVFAINSTAPLNFISNLTPRGDIVYADVNGLTDLTIRTGSLGRTELPAWGPKLIGPFTGIGSLGAPNIQNIPVVDTAFAPEFTGGVFRAVNDDFYRSAEANNLFLSDIGAPYDPYLNGIIVRNGNLENVVVGGAIGDVIVPTGNIIRLQANSDGTTPLGRFEGIVGTLYAVDIFEVDVGDGLAASDPHSPFATSGIFALDDIVGVSARRITGSFIAGPINAANQNPVDTPEFRDGIDTISVNSRGGDFDGAYIGSMLLDDFWEGFVDGSSVYRGDIFLIDGTNADLYASTISANIVNIVRLNSGAWDATFLQAANLVNTITAAEYRNTTLVGGSLEAIPSRIRVVGDLGTVSTFGRTGDLTDLGIEVIGDVTGEISGRNFTRVTIDVAGDVRRVETTNDIRASRIEVGSTPIVRAGRTIQSSEIIVSGRLSEVNAGFQINNSSISVTGPDGRIERIIAEDLLSGSIATSGPIDSITSTEGDIRATITTTTDRGNVAKVSASRDLDIETDISGTLGSISAGRHIGNRANPSTIVVRGSLTDVDAGGQLYSTLRVGQSITGKVEIGRVPATPSNNQLGAGSIIAFGAINQVYVQGDFNGDVISYSGGINEVFIFNGSFLPGRQIAAFDGNIFHVAVVEGDLMGSVYADQILYLVSVVGSADGVFGDVGINPFKFSSVAYDAFRNQLPIGVAATPNIDGPRIAAGWNIGQINVTNGSMFETSVVAGRAIGFVAVFGDIANDPFTTARGNVIAAADSIWSVGVTGSISNANIIAGLVSFGADNRPGGLGVNADTNASGWINDIFAGTGAANVAVSAGMLPGSDGVYNTADDLVASGLSVIGTVRFPAGTTVQNVTVYSDSLNSGLILDPRLLTAGFNFAIEESELWNGFQPLGTPIPSTGLPFAWNGSTGTIFFSGNGGAFWNANLGRVWLVNTDFNASLGVVVDGANPTLTNFDVVSNDDASIGTLYIGANLAGNSDIIIDAYAVYVVTGIVSGNGRWDFGKDVGTIQVNGWTGGSYDAKLTAYFTSFGDVGNADYTVRGEANISSLAFGFITFGNNNRARVNADRELYSISTAAAMDGATVRSGSTITFFSAGSMSRTWVSARDAIAPPSTPGAATPEIEIEGDVFDSSIMAGADLGRDTEFGGTGLNADEVTTGFIGKVTIGGNFRESDIVAGIIRGADGFFGTSDDGVAEGRGSIGEVTIEGSQVGSERSSESYRITSSGTIGTVRIGGRPGQNSANFALEALVLPPLPFQVRDLQVTSASNFFTARLFFNQPANSSTIASALAISEIRDNGATQIRLVLGVDYTLSYDANLNASVVTFSRALINRNLPQQPGVPGPGVYRFELNQALLQAKLVRSKLDGNSDGLAAAGENYSKDDFVGDAGDRLTSGRVTSGPITIDQYAPFNLSLVLDDNAAPDSLPDPNAVTTIRGSIGDHPDHDANFFRFSGDIDVYQITLQAGQILRLGGLTGSAQDVLVRSLFNAGGSFISPVEAITLPIDQFSFQSNPDQSWLIKQTGTYFVVVGNGTNISSNTLFNPNPVPGGTGDYAFTVEVFDDGDTGFNASTDSGNGANVANAPAPLAVAGPNGVFNNPGDANFDDISQIVIGEYVFTLNAGADGIRGTADDLVSGSNADGSIVATHSGTGRQASTVSASIGARGNAGLPNTITPDADVFRINNGSPIAVGTKVRVTVQLADLGSDLGSRSQFPRLNTVGTPNNPEDLIGDVQFGIFDITSSVATDDGVLILSPSDFSPTAGRPGVIAASDSASYGFDANGDFFVEFLAPGRFGSDTLPAAYAVYVQGVYNTDYRVEIVLDGTGTITKSAQNVLLETRGGSIDWLEVSGKVTQLTGFDPITLGFNGTLANGQAAAAYILEQTRNQLQRVFDDAGLAVNFSTNPADFEFQPYSTVYLTSGADPVTLLFGDDLLPSLTLSQLFPQLIGQSSLQPYGYSERTDVFNADKSDDAVVFIPPFSLLGFSNSQQDVDRFVSSLTASVGRRVGELLGLRLAADFSTNAGSFDIMAANSVNSPNVSTQPLDLFGGLRLLSGQGDTTISTDFYLGSQNSVALLSKYVTAG